MKYKPMDKVRIKSLDWYNENKDEDGDISCGIYDFVSRMTKFCGKVLTIKEVYPNFYTSTDPKTDFYWTDEMIEGLVEEETKPNVIEEAKTYWDSIKDAWICPDGYQFKDENGNVINATKIVLEKKKKEYPKTYEECCETLDIIDNKPPWHGYRSVQLKIFQILLICRDAYWKMAGEEMGLGKPWEPDWTDDNAKYSIYTIKGELTKAISCYDGAILTFPTEEMRDAFYENFKSEIEICKELL